MSALDSPSHLQEGGNRNRGIEHRQIAAQESVRLKRTLAEDANAAVAEIVKATFKFLWRGARCLTRQQSPCMHFKHLRVTLMLASFPI